MTNIPQNGHVGLIMYVDRSLDLVAYKMNAPVFGYTDPRLLEPLGKGFLIRNVVASYTGSTRNVCIVVPHGHEDDVAFTRLLNLVITQEQANKNPNTANYKWVSADP